MTNHTRDSELESHVRQFLRALDQRPDELIQQHITHIDTPDLNDLEDVRRYISDLEGVYGRGLQDMYERITSHGAAICELTDETEITDRVQQMMTLVAADAADVPKVQASLQDAANEVSPRTVIGLLLSVLGAGARGLPRQDQLDQLMVDFTTYCLRRFPPVDDD